jgi:hypothetical protein
MARQATNKTVPLKKSTGNALTGELKNKSK